MANARLNALNSCRALFRQEEAYEPLRALEPFTGFRDASCGVPTYQLPVHQVIAGMWRAKEVRGLV